MADPEGAEGAEDRNQKLWLTTTAMSKLNESIAVQMVMALPDKLCKWHDGDVLYAAYAAAPLLRSTLCSTQAVKAPHELVTTQRTTHTTHGGLCYLRCGRCFA